jgi:hypothetical protein
MVKAQHLGEKALAQKIAGQLAPLFKLVGLKVPGTRTLPNGTLVQVEDRFRNPVPVNTMMEGLGMNVGPCRRPLGLLPAAGVQIVRDTLRAVYAASPEVLAPIEAAFDVSIGARLEDDAVWAGLTR